MLTFHDEAHNVIQRQAVHGLLVHSQESITNLHPAVGLGGRRGVRPHALEALHPQSLVQQETQRLLCAEGHLKLTFRRVNRRTNDAEGEEEDDAANTHVHPVNHGDDVSNPQARVWCMWASVDAAAPRRAPVAPSAVVLRDIRGNSVSIEMAVRVSAVSSAALTNAATVVSLSGWPHAGGEADGAEQPRQQCKITWTRKCAAVPSRLLHGFALIAGRLCAGPGCVRVVQPVRGGAGLSVRGTPKGMTYSYPLCGRCCSANTVSAHLCFPFLQTDELLRPLFRLRCVCLKALGALEAGQGRLVEALPLLLQVCSSLPILLTSNSCVVFPLLCFFFPVPTCCISDPSLPSVPQPRVCCVSCSLPSGGRRRCAGRGLVVSHCLCRPPPARIWSESTRLGDRTVPVPSPPPLRFPPATSHVPHRGLALTARAFR